MPKHAGRANRRSAKPLARLGAAARVGTVATAGASPALQRSLARSVSRGLPAGAAAAVLLGSAALLAGPAAWAVTPLETYFGPGLPLDSYFPQGVPGTTTEPGVTVRSRVRPEYDTPPIQVGAFEIKPQFDEQAGYDSNVVGGSYDGKGSSELQSGGSVAFNSNYSRDNFGITAGINDTRYFDVPRMSHTDYNVSAGGGLDIGRDVLYGSVSYLSSYEEPYDIGSSGTSIIQLNKPLNFTDTDFRVSYTSTLGRIILTPNVDYQLINFSTGNFTNLPINDIEAFNQTLRDFNVLQGGVVARYEFAPQRDAVLVVNGNYDHYVHGQKPGFGIVDSTGATVLAGLDYQLTGATTVRALAGYQERFFSGNNVGNQGAPIGEADVIWNPTGLTTVTAQYARTIEDATTNSVTGFTYDRLNLVVDHELYRDLLLQANGRFEHAIYQGSSFTQTNFGGGAGATYLINRYLQLALSYEFIEHDGSGGTGNIGFLGTLTSINTNGNFGEHQVLLHLRVGL